MYKVKVYAASYLERTTSCRTSWRYSTSIADQAQREQEQAAIESTVRKNVSFIKEYIEEKLSIHDVPYEMVWTIYVELLDNYTCCVREMFPGMREEGVNGARLRQEDLQEVWTAIEAILPVPDQLKPSVVLSTNAYAFCRRSPGAAAEKWIKLHLRMVCYLLQNAMSIPPEKLTQLQSLSYWAFVFYSEKAKLRHSNYSKISHYFHCDLMLTLITVRYRHCRQQGCYVTHSYVTWDSANSRVQT